MTKADPLLLNFATNHPDEVGKLLASEDISSVVELLEALPDTLASAITAHLRSGQLSETLRRLAPQKIGQLLLGARYADLMAMLAHFPTDQYDALLAATPEADRERLARLISTTQHTLSTIATTDFIRVRTDRTCNEVRGELATESGESDKPIFAVDEDGRFQGMVSPLAIMAEKNAALPIQLVMKPLEALSGQMPIAAASSASQWLHYLALPVVDAYGHILGAVTLQGVRANEDTAGAVSSLEDVLAEVATAYIDTCADLLETAVSRDDR
ncbi:MAG: magnesium transporter MgtE N-terminal domain-containing protein [Pseudomonadota bacterium]